MNMDDIYAIRLERFRQVMNERFGGKQSAIAAAVGKPANYVSRVLSGSKKLGEDMAREFEVTLRKPSYWFDGLDVELAWPFSVPADAYQRLDEQKKRELDVLVRAFVAGATPSDQKSADTEPRVA